MARFAELSSASAAGLAFPFIFNEYQLSGGRSHHRTFAFPATSDARALCSHVPCVSSRLLGVFKLAVAAIELISLTTSCKGMALLRAIQGARHSGGSDSLLIC